MAGDDSRATCSTQRSGNGWNMFARSSRMLWMPSLACCEHDRRRSPTLMLSGRARWTKLGRILKPDSEREWMATYKGASFAVARADGNVVDVYVTGRDSRNRSRLGVITL